MRKIFTLCAALMSCPRVDDRLPKNSLWQQLQDALYRGRIWVPGKIPWLLNSIYVLRTVQSDADGSEAVHYAWFGDFRALQNK